MDCFNISLVFENGKSQNWSISNEKSYFFQLFGLHAIKRIKSENWLSEKFNLVLDLTWPLGRERPDRLLMEHSLKFLCESLCNLFLNQSWSEIICIQFMLGCFSLFWLYLGSKWSDFHSACKKLLEWENVLFYIILDHISHIGCI